MIEGERILSLADTVSFQNMGEGEGAVVLQLSTGQLHTCNDTTSEFLTILDGKRTFDLVVSSLEEKFDVDPVVLRADLSELAERLLAEGVIA